MVEQKHHLEGAMVWGLQGSPRDDQHRLVHRWPCVKGSDEQYYMITDHKGGHAFVGQSEDEAEEAVVLLTSTSERLPYENGKSLATAGEEYFGNLLELSRWVTALKPLLKGFVIVQAENCFFWIKQVTQEEYEQLRRIVAEAAKALFDRHFFREDGTINSWAKMALRILRGVYTPVKMDYSLRELIDLRLGDDEESYSTTLTLVSDGEKIPQADLEKMIDAWIEVAKLKILRGYDAP